MRIADGPGHGDRPSDHEVEGHECVLALQLSRTGVVEVAARVAACSTVVPEDEDPVRRHDHVEADLRRIDDHAVRRAEEVARSSRGTSLTVTRPWASQQTT